MMADERECGRGQYALWLGVYADTLAAPLLPISPRLPRRLSNESEESVSETTGGNS